MKCTIMNCNSNQWAKTYCSRHYDQMKKYGKVVPTKYEARPAILKDNYALIPLGVEACNGYAKIDKEFIWLEKYQWSKDVKGNAKARVDGKVTSMESLVLPRTHGKVIDHTNHDRLDNRTANLRLCSLQENRLNSVNDRNSTVRYKGVWKPDYNGKYKAQIMYKGEKFYLGSFDTAEKAAKAYDEKAKELHGEFAYLNFNDNQGDY